MHLEVSLITNTIQQKQGKKTILKLYTGGSRGRGSQPLPPAQMGCSEESKDRQKLCTLSGVGKWQHPPPPPPPPHRPPPPPPLNEILDPPHLYQSYNSKSLEDTLQYCKNLQDAYSINKILDYIFTRSWRSTVHKRTHSRFHSIIAQLLSQYIVFLINWSTCTYTCITNTMQQWHTANKVLQ